MDGNTVRVKGPKGTLERTFRPEVDIALEDGELKVTRQSDAKRDRAFHGLSRALLANMVTGVTDGFSKTLEMAIGKRRLTVCLRRSGSQAVAGKAPHRIP